METSTQLQTLNTQPEESAFSIKGFEHAQRVSVMMAKSNLIPVAYQNKVENCLIALEMANRIGASPLMVMQNLHIIQGKPSWSSPFIIASLNSCGRFSKLNWRKSGTGDDYGYEAYATDKKSGEELVGPKVTLAMVKAEGWLAKPGSKWKTMPELMYQYRSAAFFGRLHAPDVLMGMQALEEVIDVIHEEVEPVAKADKENERLKLLVSQATTLEKLEGLRPHLATAEQQELFEQKVKELA